MVVPIGMAIAGSIGWALGLLIVKKARQIKGNEKENWAQSLPWTQRITTGANIGSTLGCCMGFAIGCAGFVLAGPAGVILAVNLFGAIGAIVGSVAGALYDDKARGLIWKGIKSIFGISEGVEAPATQEITLSSSSIEIPLSTDKPLSLPVTVPALQNDSSTNEKLERPSSPQHSSEQLEEDSLSSSAQAFRRLSQAGDALHSSSTKINQAYVIKEDKSESSVVDSVAPPSQPASPKFPPNSTLFSPQANPNFINPGSNTSRSVSTFFAWPQQIFNMFATRKPQEATTTASRNSLPVRETLEFGTV